jgi:hypothetical protein
MQSDALITGWGLPDFGCALPVSSGARCTLHNAMGAPQAEQNAALMPTGLLQRGQATVFSEDRTGAAAEAVPGLREEMLFR